MIARHFLTIAAVLALLGLALPAQAADDPLASWRDGKTKQTIISFVDKVTRKGGPDYVPPGERIATFDNDGTLWSEQPMYVQLFFALDRLKEMAPRHPEWKKIPAVQAALAGDLPKLAKLGHKGILKIVGLTHAGLTSQQMQALAKTWLSAARNPKKDMLFAQMIYQPMVELLAYLRAHGFKTFIVSGGGVDFIRAFSRSAYGVPPYQVIGSSLKGKFQLKGGKAEVIRLPEINSIDDGPGKPQNIALQIGLRPIMAVGNSDGDLAMLQYTASGPGPRLMMLLHHDDAAREFAYDRKSHIGRLDKGLDLARQNGWTLISMKNDFAQVFPACRK
ncbi:MAG: haloacid dehalogenase-like hydrolase [Desulfarculaceae bacterium]|nr:haloacid dehalogenase-like hydrolase [Desulfarculaceae bacterium]MCF8071511.1 haloacid dehalogenase-like hydrolase [Desulfarculaceae bacterium]MCF8102326.1 haloacid dehalogenase-like hydrolase [Desulfarculaceae bacterium]MCF8114790.1 haloacid dehalogenase-like hydrolase [Desulfarculaceae bacterium]